jgi:hypothetical protein
MTDWRAAAKASGFDFPEADLDRITPVLQALESALIPLARTLDYTTEPAVILSETAVSPE